MLIGAPFGRTGRIVLGTGATLGGPDLEGRQLAEAIEDWHEEHDWTGDGHKR